jgi:hypothetical protein
MHIDHHVKYPNGQTLIKLEFSRQILEKYLNIKFHENLSSGTELLHSGRKDGQTNRGT